MQLQTIVPIDHLPEKITYDSRIVSLGSCFAVHMAQKLSGFQFRNSVNPLGILFHPKALERLFEFSVENRVFSEKDVFIHNGIWSCFDAHSDLNDLDQENIINRLNLKVSRFRDELEHATHLILTLGTAWVYRYTASGELVANCHKVPQKHFVKELLPIPEIVKSLDKIRSLISKINPGIKCIYTISPVRHIKDGFSENQRSKAHLIAALHEHLEQASGYYFPSYELVMDEMRDYRFFAQDMLHPNTQAIDYIWERFTACCIDPVVFNTMKLVDEVQRGLSHHPFNPYSDAHEKFLEHLARKIDQLLEDHPFMNFR